MKKTYKVLIVDDDKVIVRLLSAWLNKAGFEIQTASSGEEAMPLIEEFAPELIVTDWEMPGMSGPDLCRWIRNLDIDRYIYVLFLTARSATEELVYGMETGADDFMKKPFEKGELLARLQAGIRVLEMESRLQSVASTDPLTGLATRRAFRKKLETEWNQAHRHNMPLSCVMADIDYFKRINDTYGHPVGDAVLKQFAHTLEENCRAADMVCRFGGEEFCIVLPMTPGDNAFYWTERIRQVIMHTPVNIQGQEIKITASFGLSERLKGTTEPEDLIKNADKALYQAKKNGRNQSIMYSKSLGTPDDNTLTEENVFENIQARHVMTSIMAPLHMDSNVANAVRYFLDFQVGTAPVTDDQGLLVGILSELDILNIMLSNEWESIRIKDIMRTDTVCYEEDDCALSIYQFLCRASFRSIPVLRQGKPVGIIRRSDFVRWFRNLKMLLPGETDILNGTPLEGWATSENKLDPGVTNATENDAHSGQASGFILESAMQLISEVETLKDTYENKEHEEGRPAIISGISRIQDLIGKILVAGRQQSPVGPNMVRGAAPY